MLAMRCPTAALNLLALVVALIQFAFVAMIGMIMFVGFGGLELMRR